MGANVEIQGVSSADSTKRITPEINSTSKALKTESNALQNTSPTNALKQFTTSVASSGENDVLTPTAGKKINLVTLNASIGGTATDVDVHLGTTQSGTNTMLTVLGAVNGGATNGPWQEPNLPRGAADEKLRAKLSGANTVSVSGTYYET